MAIDIPIGSGEAGTLGDLDVSEFQALIAEYGEVPALYRRFLGACPRSVSAVEGMNEPDPECPLCGGTGQLWQTWTAPDGSPTGGRLFAQQCQVGRTIGNVQAVQGDMRCSFFQPDYPMGAQDRLYLRSRTVEWHETIRRNRQDVGGAIVAVTTTDPLTYGPVAKIVMVIRATGESVAKATVPSGRYDISADLRGITWKAAGLPADGADYTVFYEYFVAWQVPRGSVYRRVRAEDLSFFPHNCLLRPCQPGPTSRVVGQVF